MLLRSWIGEPGRADRAAWVPVGRGEQDPQRFWLSVLGALRGTSAGSGLVRELTAAPDLDGWAVVERLLKDLTPLADRLWLVIDDMHELRSAEALAQLELLVMRAPPELRFVLATRHDLRLGLHRLRLDITWFGCRPPLACAFVPIAVVCPVYLRRVSGMAAPMSSKAWRCWLVGSVRTGTVAGVRRSAARYGSGCPGGRAARGS